MVDLSSLKPAKPGEDSPTPSSASDQPSPSDLPLNQSLKEKLAGTTDKAALPPLKEEEKIVTTGQKEIEKELSEIGISPKGSSKKTRIIMATLGVLLLVATLPAAVYLVKQRQEIRRQATYPTPCKVCQLQSCKDSGLAGCSHADDECATNSDCAYITPCKVCQLGSCKDSGLAGCSHADDECAANSDCAAPCKICQDGLCKDSGLANCSHSADQCTDNITCNAPVSPSPSPGASPSPSASPAADFCGGCGKAPGWSSSNQGPTECNGTQCNAGGWNYCCWDEDHNGTCDICARGGGPGVDCSGNCISLSGLTPGSTVKFCSFYSNNDVSCPYSTGSLNCSNVTVPSNGSITRCISDDKCGQLEADGYCGVCKDTGCGGPPPSEPPESPPPSLPPDTALCQFCKIYDEDWNEITNLSTFTIGQTIYLATQGTTSNPQGITKARIRVNGGDWQETTQKHGNKYYIQYTIPSAGSYTIESMVYNPDLGWY